LQGFEPYIFNVLETISFSKQNLRYGNMVNILECKKMGKQQTYKISELKISNEDLNQELQRHM
jgi:hypothetical protein